MEQNKIIIEDEIDLKELFSVIWQRKIFVISFTLLITIVSIIYAYTKIPIYEVKSIMEIGFLENKVIDDPAVVEQKLNIIFGVEDKNTNSNPEKGIITSIKKDKDVKNFIEIKTEAISNDIALAKNKEVLELTKQLYNNKIEQFKTFSNNDIVNIQREIDYVNNVEIKNILSQINILKEQEIFKINREIENLKNQNLKTANNEIDFLKNEKLKKLNEKISFYRNNLEKFDKEINELNKTISINQDKTALLVLSTQLINYQNLILNTQNQINELELQVQQIIKETLPKLEINKENIFLVQIKDLEMKKQNVSNDTIKKLEDKINIELKTKISQLEERKNTAKFKLSEENISNARLVGNYVVSDYPAKPKKMLIIAVSFITGFILSIFIVFILNFINNSRKV